MASLLLMGISCGEATIGVDTTVVSTTITTDSMSDAIADVTAAIEGVSVTMADIKTADATMAWDDLRSDLISATSDLARDPSTVDVEGFGRRMNNFMLTFDLGDEPSWNDLTSAFQTLVENIQRPT